MKKAKNLFGKHSVEKFPSKTKNFWKQFLRKNLYEKITLPGAKT